MMEISTREPLSSYHISVRNGLPSCQLFNQNIYYLLKRTLTQIMGNFHGPIGCQYLQVVDFKM